MLPGPFPPRLAGDDRRERLLTVTNDSPPPRLPPRVSTGEVCAWCMREFAQPHGRPVYCERCSDNAFATRKSFGLLPRAVHPLKRAAP